MTELELKIYKIVAGIPEGKIMTYGQIAELLGNKKLCRVVGNAMHKNPVPFVELARECGYKGNFKIDAATEAQFLTLGIGRVPCHRVVNASGKPGANFGLGGPEVQARMLQSEITQAL